MKVLGRFIKRHLGFIPDLLVGYGIAQIILLIGFVASCYVLMLLAYILHY